MTSELKMYVNAAIWNDRLEVLLQVPERDQATGLKQIVTSMTIETKEPGRVVDPSFAMSYGDAKALMNQLWNAGIRPTDVKDSTALEAHLLDMRMIAFKKLGITQ
jgi:hypothetical protein